MFRALNAGATMIGFNAAYVLLGLQQKSGRRGAVDLGARIAKPFDETSYGTLQSIIRDSEDNIFSINAPLLAPLLPQEQI